MLIGSGMLFKAQCCLIPPQQDERDREGNFGACACCVDPVSWGMPSRARAVPDSLQVMGTSNSLSDLSKGQLAWGPNPPQHLSPCSMGGDCVLQKSPHTH